MVKNTPPPTCSKCGKPKRFMLVKSGGRKFRCIDCDVPDPLKTLEMQNLLLLKSPDEILGRPAADRGIRGHLGW
jgi:hypothetical protein